MCSLIELKVPEQEYETGILSEWYCLRITVVRDLTIFVGTDRSRDETVRSDGIFGGC